MNIPIHARIPPRPHRLALSFLLAVFVGTCQPILADEPRIDYDRDVRPILAAHCFRCHGPDKQESGLRLDVRARALAGGDGGVAIVAGQSAASALIRRVRSTDGDERMPPTGDRLSDQQAQLLARWIDDGATGIPESGARSTAARHWAFRPIRSPALPAVSDQAWPRNPTDTFVLQRLGERSLQPTTQADRSTLARRLYLDLVGLPPPWSRVAEFADDRNPDAYERLADELLASPAFGERWGRHWLDLARYADSSGYESDQPREIWAYRDWVIRALNSDKPYDEFIVEQLAGDLLPQATIDQRIATGFHCNAMLDLGVRQESVLDQVNTTGTVLLGLTVGCAQCHSHKTDPFTQRDYYQLYAFFNEASPALMQFDGQFYEPPPKPADGQSPPTPSPPKPTTTLVLRPTPQPTRIFIRGDTANPGEEVPPGMPAFLATTLVPSDRPAEPAPVAVASSVASGRLTRLDLARWLVAPRNPLPARVAANRIWQHLLGLGLVETENDFGLQTPEPMHAGLLDHLAVQLCDPNRHTWNGPKRLVRHIVTSATYRQDTRGVPAGIVRDPGNGLLARQRRLRLDAEAIRDATLATSGLLDRRVGGPSVFPEQPDGILLNRATPATWETSPGGNRYRRGIYTWVWRLTPHPHLPLFDAPDGVTACTRRDRSNVPVQALALLNDPTFFAAAAALAELALASGAATDDDRLRWLVRTCLSREPQAGELHILKELLNEQRRDLATRSPTSQSPATEHPNTALDGPNDRAVWTVVARVVLNLDEFITRP